MMDSRDRKACAAGHGRPQNLRPRMSSTRTKSNVEIRAREARETCPFLTTKEAAFFLGLAVVTLAAMRRKGTGPKCRRHGRDWRYHIDDLEAWSLSDTVGGAHD
ncbi:helix-turn-helix domain-containing protein [Novosphingobium sp. BL-8H]|uniref:helix-turn-helix domain-containing protein n=2 Tax=unclassified Novosphingobium TaxID=2644732 RepID=UPI00375697F4